MRRASVAGPGGQRRDLAEELELDAVADDVAVGEQADHVVGLERPQHLAGRRRARGARCSCPAGGGSR